jgi:hypothetical protein
MDQQNRNPQDTTRKRRSQNPIGSQRKNFGFLCAKLHAQRQDSEATNSRFSDFESQFASPLRTRAQLLQSKALVENKASQARANGAALNERE